VQSKVLNFTPLRCRGRDSLTASGVRNMDTSLPDRIFEVIPIVEDGPPVNPSIRSYTAFPRLSQSHQEVGGLT
jgi:hypothetical protein